MRDSRLYIRLEPPLKSRIFFFEFIAMPRALIVGISGQDGAYLARHLLACGYDVHGTSRGALTAQSAPVRLGLADKLSVHQLDPLNCRAVADIFSSLAPDEIYMLSGQSSVGLSFQNPAETFASIADATVHVLDGLRTVLPHARLFCAGSSECFGSQENPADIGTPFAPISPYAAAKCAAYWAVAVYRRSYGLFATTGMLYNHESPLRPSTYVTRKIISAAASIADNRSERLALGNIDIARDWGWSPEYVEAMHQMLQRDEPDDYVIATGESRPLRDFVVAAFAAVGLNWQDHVDMSTDLHRPSEVLCSRAAVERTRDCLGWTATTRFDGLVRKLVACERSGTLG